MPAIQPARLKQQAAALAEHFDDPPAYIRSLHHLLDFYSDRARRPGQSGGPAPLIESYNVRPPVLRGLLLELLPLVEKDGEQALALCDALWAEPYRECRELAAMLLGKLPASYVDGAIDRVKRWISPALEMYQTDLLLTTGLGSLHQERPQALLNLIQGWLEHPQVFYHQLGLRALLPLIRDPKFENLPVFFRLVGPYTRIAPAALRPEVLDLLNALAERSPYETVYFLRQMLVHPDSPDTPLLVRQSLKHFPEALQAELKQAIGEQGARRSPAHVPARFKG